MITPRNLLRCLLTWQIRRAQRTNTFSGPLSTTLEFSGIKSLTAPTEWSLFFRAANLPNTGCAHISPSTTTITTTVSERSTGRSKIPPPIRRSSESRRPAIPKAAVRPKPSVRHCCRTRLGVGAQQAPNKRGALFFIVINMARWHGHCLRILRQ